MILQDLIKSDLNNCVYYSLNTFKYKLLVCKSTATDNYRVRYCSNRDSNISKKENYYRE